MFAFLSCCVVVVARRRWRRSAPGRRAGLNRGRAVRLALASPGRAGPRVVGGGLNYVVWYGRACLETFER